MYQAKRKIKVVLIGLLFMNLLCAQQDPQYSHYMFNQMAYNPAYAGSSPDIVSNLTWREQWMGFVGRPQIQNLNVSVPFKLLNMQHGAGLTVYNDVIGNYVSQNIGLAYSIKFKMGDGNLGIGTQVGATIRTFDIQEEWKTSTFNSAWSGPKDENDNNLDINAGLYYNTDELYLGISATHVYASEFEYVNEDGNKITEQLKPHYFLTAGYVISLTNPAFELFPSVLISSDAQTSKYDINTTVIYNNKIWGGLSYRVGAAVTGLAGFEPIQNLRIGLAYDFGTTDFNQFAPSTTEVFVNYNFSLKVEKLPQRYKSIRYL
jgi:type IX secretion system PorP/SprF family membrane protein